ncbi:TonB-dependent receptor [Pedobacter sp. MC2016-14]|uniref:SusC/RagA family TonB-linked outer membrane protein n=1 Tax=Pedobacter sp. MC2016-14 TaxID=2897327 RepID=UPI001E2D2DE5|nr:TonB-dependent receptor [Pedobacter sp. MC2016-14]MCD0487641.1 TonB-dependent receptor [Pedobacter sp. MC2016-14]
MRKYYLIALLCAPFLSLYAQNQKQLLTGRVLDEESKQTMVGVSVTLKGTKTAGMTDENGNFKLSTPTGPQVLVFKYIGYETEELTVNSSKPISIQLKPSSNSLQEVEVNVGYGTVNRERLAGAVSSIKAKDIADFPVSTAAEALAGKLAGVSVVATEGAPGSEIKILVRGGTSITQDNSPLYIVDGIPLDNALSIISPSEIASIDVLKDLASTSIYGARGANGVVLITTKTGKAGRTIVSFDTYAGVRKITNYLDMMKPYDYLLMQYAGNRGHFSGSITTDSTVINGFYRRYGNIEDWDIYKSYPAVNWTERVFGRSAFSNTQVLTFSGGNKTSTYNFSVNRTDEDGIMLNSNLARTFATFRYDNDISKTFKVGVNVRYSNQLVTGNGTSIKGSNGGLQNSVRFQPYLGTINLQQVNEDDVSESRIDLSTPVDAATRDQRLNRNADLITSGYLNVKISPKLTFRSNIGYRVGENKNDSFRGVVRYEVSSFSNFGTYKDQPYVDLIKGRTVNITNTNTLSYGNTFKKNHKLDIVVGEETNTVTSDNYSQTVRYFPNDVTWQSAFANLQQANAPQGFVQPSPTSFIPPPEKLLSFFGRTQYSYKSRYNLNLALRTDGSSKFGPGNRWSSFPSAQFAWRMSEEQFFKSLKANWINGFKFRASYGTAGNNRISSDRLYTTVFGTAQNQGYAESDNSQTPGLYSLQLQNPGLKWETTVSQNLGLDLDLFDNRLTASVDVYSNKTSDLLLNANIPAQNGYASQTQNIGATRNKGLELQLSYVVVKSKNWTYNTAFNLSFNRNKIVELNGNTDPDYGYGVNSGWGIRSEEFDFLVQVGKPLGQFYGYVVDGWFTMEDFDRPFYESELAAGRRTFREKPGVPTGSLTAIGQNAAPGVLKVKDLNGDGVLTAEDKTVLGTYQPKFFGGFNNQVSYKGFDMSVFINFSYGGKTYNANKTVLGSRYQVNGNNFLQKFANSWKYFDDKGNILTNWDDIVTANANVTSYAPTYGQPVALSDAIEDASFLRITNITLGYTLPAKLLERVRAISRLRIYATVNNLHTFTKYTGFDPEASTRNSPLTPGVDYSAYPRNRYILAGLNVSF